MIYTLYNNLCFVVDFVTLIYNSIKVLVRKKNEKAIYDNIVINSIYMQWAN